MGDRIGLRHQDTPHQSSLYFAVSEVPQSTQHFCPDGMLEGGVEGGWLAPPLLQVPGELGGLGDAPGGWRPFGSEQKLDSFCDAFSRRGATKAPPLTPPTSHPPSLVPSPSQPAHIDCFSVSLQAQGPPLPPPWLQQDGKSSSPNDKESAPMYPGDAHEYRPQEEFILTDPCGLQSLGSPLGQYPQSFVSLPPLMDHVTPWHPEAADSTSLAPPLCSVAPPTASWTQCTPEPQHSSPPVYTGVPFSTLLHASRSWYTPAPMLNPHRKGAGLYRGLRPPPPPAGGNHEDLWDGERGDCQRIPRINVGPAFQAEIPQLQESKQSEGWPEEEEEEEEEEPLREELLWKPSEKLEESAALQEKVDSFLDLCSSSALPGGGTNTELALHCLSRCHGDVQAAVEMLLLSPSPSSKDYHYCGSDVWMLSERRLFNKAFSVYNKNFSLIHRMVKTKRVSQCVEFYYLSKKLPEQQRKQRERERALEGDAGSTTDSSVSPMTNQVTTPLGMEDIISSSAMATSFPCKQCGKMFYKIKSRNAHMKIHRQQQENWRDGNQNVMFNTNFSPAQARLAFLQNPNNQLSSLANPGFSPSGLPLYASPHPAWDPYDIVSDPNAFYYDSEGKVMLGVTGGGKGQIRWQ